MKKNIILISIILILILSNPFSGHSQYQPLLINNTQWYLFHYFEGGCNETYTIRCDTFTFGKTYRIVEANPWCGWNAPKTVLLREDTNKRKVFYIYDPIHDSTEQLLYDFGLSVGDTFTSNNGTIVLDSVSNILHNYGMPTEVNISSLKVFYSHCIPQIYTEPWVIWIEGIGSLKGLFEPCAVWGQGVYGGSLLCHFNRMGFRDFHYTFNGEPAPCTGDGIAEFGKNNSVKVSPNPFSTSTQISFGKTYQSLDLSLIDLQGKTIQQKSYHDCNKINLDRTGIANGFYFLRVSLDGKFVETKKIVVTD